MIIITTTTISETSNSGIKTQQCKIQVGRQPDQFQLISLMHIDSAPYKISG